MNPWSDILFLDSSMLNHAIADPSDCIANAATLEDIICVRALIAQFAEDYGLQLNKEERKALGEIGCMEDYDDFVEEAWEKFAIYFTLNPDTTEGEYSFEEGFEGLCWNSLTLTKIGDHYYIIISPFEFQLHHAQTNTWIDFSAPSLCMSSSGIAFLNSDTNPQLMADHSIKKAFKNVLEFARRGMFTQYNRGKVPPQAVAGLQFKTSILFNLKLSFSGLPSINMAGGGCPGVPPSPVLWNCN